MKSKKTESKKLTLTSKTAILSAKETVKEILLLEGGPKACLIYPNHFYERPLWVPEKLVYSTAKDLFDFRDDQAASVPIRTYTTPKGTNSLRPEDRFSLYRVHYSATQRDWLRHKSKIEQDAIKASVYGTGRSPRLMHEWDCFMAHCVRQPLVKLKWADKNPWALLDFYRFVPTVVQMIDVKSPSRDSIFQLRFNPERTYYFYNCYYRGANSSTLDNLLGDSLIVSV